MLRPGRCSPTLRAGARRLVQRTPNNNTVSPNSHCFRALNCSTTQHTMSCTQFLHAQGELLVPALNEPARDASSRAKSAAKGPFCSVIRTAFEDHQIGSGCALKQFQIVGVAVKLVSRFCVRARASTNLGPIVVFAWLYGFARDDRLCLGFLTGVLRGHLFRGETSPREYGQVATVPLVSASLLSRRSLTCQVFLLQATASFAVRPSTRPAPCVPPSSSCSSPLWP